MGVEHKSFVLLLHHMLVPSSDFIHDDSTFPNRIVYYVWMLFALAYNIHYPIPKINEIKRIQKLCLSTGQMKFWVISYFYKLNSMKIESVITII